MQNNFNNNNQYQNMRNNNMNYNNNNNNNNIPRNNDISNNRSKGENKPKELLPRKDKTEYETVYKGNNPNMINIALNASSGLKIMITTTVDTTIAELFKIYVKKVGLPESVINNEIVFLFDGEKLEANNRQIGYLFKDGAKILVIDVQGIIGG